VRRWYPTLLFAAAIAASILGKIVSHGFSHGL